MGERRSVPGARRGRRHARRVRGIAIGAAATLAACAASAVSIVVARDHGARHVVAARTSDGAVRQPGGSPAGRGARRQRSPRRILVIGGRRQPTRVRVPYEASGHYVVVPGRARAPRGGRGRLVRYMVEVERGLPFRGRDFAAAVHRILNDPRSWGSGGRLRFERTDHDPVQIRVSLSSPALASRRCLPLDTGGKLSCWHSPRAIINATRWGTGAATYGKDLASYREYVINHEVGHGLGHGHLQCPRPGKPAPVMVQQTKSLGRCRRNPWPYPRPVRGSARSSRVRSSR
jgi:hypothetical protein